MKLSTIARASLLALAASGLLAACQQREDSAAGTATSRGGDAANTRPGSVSGSGTGSASGDTQSSSSSSSSSNAGGSQSSSAATGPNATASAASAAR